MPTVWEQLYQQGKIGSVTRNLVECFLLDQWPSTIAVRDFGIASQDHYAALKFSIFFDDNPAWSALEEEEIDELVDAEMQKRILELQQAINHGGRLTAFVKQYAPGHLADVKFDTGMDDFAEALEESRKRLGR